MRTSPRFALLPGSLLAAALVVVLVPGTAGAAAKHAKHTQRVSVSSAGVQGDNDAYLDPASLSANGRYVAFESAASTFVPGDTNAASDVFVRDRKLRRTTRVSVGPGGVQANDASYAPSISANGRYVAFWSYATNLVPGDTNAQPDVFVRDRKLHKTILVSVSSAGVQGDNVSRGPSISASGRYVTFWSQATNLVSGDTNAYADVFVRDLKLHRTTRVSVGPGGAQGDNVSFDPTISADGRMVAFQSAATTMVPGDTNGFSDVFVRDRELGKTILVSRGLAGAPGNGGSFTPSTVAGDRYVAFYSDATDLVPGDTNGFRDVFVRDLKTHKTTLVSVTSAGAQGNGASDLVAISASGRWVAFQSQATDLVSGDSNGNYDVFLRDRKLHRTTRVSVSSKGAEGNGDSTLPAISGDGRYVAFVSAASNLVPSDTNGFTDMFVRWPLH